MMWTREELKNNAKDVLRRGYWMPFLASLLYGWIMSFLGGNQGAQVPTLTLNYNISNMEMQSTGTPPPIQMEEIERLLENFFTNLGAAEVLSMATITAIAVIMSIVLFVVVILTTIAVSYAVQIFLVAPLNVGYSRYYLVNRTGEASFAELFGAFKTRYIQVALGQFVTELLIGLWSLLFIVPGFIYGYKWQQVSYILAENPNLTGARAREISDAMTMNEKWDMFVLDLSFLGWQILGALCCGIGSWFVTPYVQATKAELYARQREKVLAAGLATPEELPGL